MICPCCTGKEYTDCCQPFHQGIFPQNALELMRSRYSAYALKKVDYILNTTHPKNPQQPDREKINTFCDKTTFQKLDILDFLDGPVEAEVEFIAYLVQNKLPLQLHERSLFTKQGMQWLYRAMI